MQIFRVGDRVVKCEAGWIESWSDKWGAGAGVGTIVRSPKHSHIPWEPDEVDVEWPGWRRFHKESELKRAPSVPLAVMGEEQARD